MPSETFRGTRMLNRIFQRGGGGGDKSRELNDRAGGGGGGLGVNYISFEVIMDQGDKNMQCSDQNNSFTLLCPHRLCGEVDSSSVDDVTPRDGGISILAM